MMPCCVRLTAATSATCGSMSPARNPRSMTPMPPSSASTIAIAARVTVSMLADTSGRLSVRCSENRADRSTGVRDRAAGSTPHCGVNRKSSNVQPRHGRGTTRTSRTPGLHPRESRRASRGVACPAAARADRTRRRCRPSVHSVWRCAPIRRLRTAPRPRPRFRASRVAVLAWPPRTTRSSAPRRGAHSSAAWGIRPLARSGGSSRRSTSVFSLPCLVRVADRDLATLSVDGHVDRLLERRAFLNEVIAQQQEMTALGEDGGRLVVAVEPSLKRQDELAVTRSPRASWIRSPFASGVPSGDRGGRGSRAPALP